MTKRIISTLAYGVCAALLVTLLTSCTSHKLVANRASIPTSSQPASPELEEVILTGIKASSASIADFNPPPPNRDDFETFDPNPVKLVSEEPVSTFSADVDTASYSYVRRSLNDGYLPEKDAVRLEEMVNYFDYDYSKPTSAEAPFTANLFVHDAPWNKNKKLVHIGIQGFAIEPEEQPDSNLVFLLDVSGSMSSADKLPLVKKSMKLLLSQLEPSDTVAIAVYAGAAGTVLPPTAVKNKSKILKAMNRLNAGGSTAGAEGIQLAYQLAEENFKPEAVNRIILATDGDFNVGITDREKLKGYIERKREKGIYLSILGFGRGNYQDQLMQTLAQNGNGIAAYIDTLSEAQKVLVHQATSSLFPIATDLKLQVEFNHNKVHEYRLLGYETRQLKREDFNNDKVDAGDIGSGHSVTVIYEISLKDSEGQLIEDLRYQNNSLTQQKSSEKKNTKTNELAYLKIRYKLPGEKESKLKEFPILDQMPEDTVQNKLLKQEAKFATAVAGFAQILKGGQYLNDWGWDEALELAQANRGEDEYGYRSEFVQLVRKGKMAGVME